MTKVLLRPALLLLALSFGEGAALAQGAEYARQPRRTVLATQFASESYRQCDRAEVRDCQADARLDLQLCAPFAGRLDCAGAALSRLKQCWAATGCW